MWAFDPINEQLIFKQSTEDFVDGATINFEEGTDLSIDMGSVDNNGIIDQGFVINGTV